MPRDDDKPESGYLVGEHGPELLNLKFNPTVRIDSRTDQAQVAEMVSAAFRSSLARLPSGKAVAPACCRCAPKPGQPPRLAGPRGVAHRLLLALSDALTRTAEWLRLSASATPDRRA